MKILLVGDAHITNKNPIARTDNLPLAQRNKFRDITGICDEHDVNMLLLSGDVFDYPYQGYRTFTEYYAYFSFLQEMLGVTTYAVYGQHDLFWNTLESAQSTALGALDALGVVTILGSEPVVFKWGVNPLDYVWLYGASYGEEIPIIKQETGHHILVIHKMLSPRAPWKGAKEGKDYYKPSIIHDKTWFDLTLCGDWHGQFMWKSKNNTYVINPGALVRKTGGYVDYDRHPAVVLWNTVEKSFEEIVLDSAQPSEEVLTREHIEAVARHTKGIKEFVERLKAGGSSLGPSYIANLLTTMEKTRIKKSVKDKICEAIDYSSYKDLLNEKVQRERSGERTRISRDSIKKGGEHKKRDGKGKDPERVLSKKALRIRFK